MLQKDNRIKILEVFFHNPVPNYQLRELSRLTNIAPPSVKNHLKILMKEGLVGATKDRVQGHPTYNATENEYFKQLKILSTMRRLYESGTVDYLYNTCMPDCIILFGSARKGEDHTDSDIDLFVQSKEQKVDLKKYEKSLGRQISLFFASDFNKLSNELKNNVVNGISLNGYLKVF